MHVIVVPCLNDNYSYIIFNEQSREAAVVDPSEAWPVLKEIESKQLNLKSVLCTHHHGDHIGGLEDLIDEVGTLRILGFEGDRTRIPLLNELLADGDDFSVCGMSGVMLHTPGHTTGGVVYHIDNCLFTGDTLFGGGCGRLFEGTPGQMLSSLGKLAHCDPETLVYCGHEYTVVNLNFARQVEPDNDLIVKRLTHVESLRKQGVPSVPSKMGDEFQTNPFLRCHQPVFVEQLGKNYQIEDKKPEDVFAFVRGMRNNFS